MLAEVRILHEISRLLLTLALGDMFRLKNSLNGSCLYVGKKLNFAGCIRAQVKRIYIDGELVCFCVLIVHDISTACCASILDQLRLHHASNKNDFSLGVGQVFHLLANEQRDV